MRFIMAIFCRHWRHHLSCKYQELEPDLLPVNVLGFGVGPFLFTQGLGPLSCGEFDLPKDMNLLCVGNEDQAFGGVSSELKDHWNDGQFSSGKLLDKLDLKGGIWTLVPYSNSLSRVVCTSIQSKAWGLVFQTWDLMDCSIFSTFRKCQRCSNNLKRQMHILRRWDLCWQGKTTQKCGFVEESAFIFSKIKDDEIRYIHSDTDGSGKKGTQCRM